MRILVTGSADGLGRAAAERLLGRGHQVVVHARNHRRGDALAPLVGRGAPLVIGDLAQGGDVLAIADELSGAHLDAVIHNAGVYSGPALLPVNVVAPYLLTALVPAQRLVYLSSGMHTGGRPSLTGIDWAGRGGSYSDSKLLVTVLMAAVARLRPDVLSNAVDPGWVPTKMGGPGAPDDLEEGHRTQEWLVTSDDAEARTSGGYWHHRRRLQPHRAVHDATFQDELLASLATETGVPLSWPPAGPGRFVGRAEEHPAPLGCS